MTQYVSSTARTCFFHLRRIRQVRRCPDETCCRILVQALVISRLDYCISVLSGLPSSTLQSLSSVLHTAARLIKDLSHRDHITPTLKQLHWLSIHARIAFKISLLMYHIHSGTSPLIHVIHGYAMLCFQVQRTPIIHARGFCCNSHKSEVWQSCFIGRWT